MKMKRSIQIVMVAAALVFVSNSSAQDNNPGPREPNVSGIASSTPARMWEVTGGKNGKRIKPIYLLAVTHDGLPAEYDQYLDTTVLPALKQADVFMDESAMLYSHAIPECKDQTIVSRKDREAIDRARATAQRMFATIREPLEKDSLVPNIHQMHEEVARLQVEHLSEYGIIAAMRAYRNTLNRRGKTNNSDRVKIVDYLKEKKLNSIYESIDTPDDLVQAYCDLGRERIKYFSEEAEFYGVKETPSPTPEAIRIGNSAFKGTLNAGVLYGALSDDTDAEYRSFVCKRNKKWIDAIEKSSTNQSIFLALGISHFFPLRKRNSPCDGILHDLEEKGYSIKLIQATN